MHIIFSFPALGSRGYPTFQIERAGGGVGKESEVARESNTKGKRMDRKDRGKVLSQMNIRRKTRHDKFGASKNVRRAFDILSFFPLVRCCLPMITSLSTKLEQKLTRHPCWTYRPLGARLILLRSLE